MYRHLIKYVLCQLAVITVFGCSSDADINTGDGEKTPVTFNLAGTPLNVTRTTTHEDNSWAINLEVAVKCTEDQDPNNSQLNQVKKYVTADNDASGYKLVGSDEANTFFWFSSRLLSFQFWYPYSAAMPTSMTVAADQRNSQVTDAVFDAYDLLYAEQKEVTPAISTLATLPFYHQMSLMTLNVTIDGSVTDETLESVTLNSDGDIFLTCSSWTPVTANDDATSSAKEGAEWGTLSDAVHTITPRQLSGGKYVCILPPQDLPASTTLTFTTRLSDNSVRTYKLVGGFEGGLSLCAGNNHVINATVSRIGVTAKIVVTPWDPEGSGSALFGRIGLSERITVNDLNDADRTGIITF